MADNTLDPNFGADFQQKADNTMIGIIAFGVVMFILTIGMLFFFYNQYSRGQRVCERLYPGTSLHALRAQEDCKKKKRHTWALPTAAMLI